MLRNLALLLSYAYIGLFTLCLYAQDQGHEYEFSIFKIEDGLADNSINRITQDKDGFIWIATDNGLSRYDGSNFLNYTNFDKEHFIRRNQINDFHIGKDGLIYLGTDQGVDILNSKTGKVTSILPSDNVSQGLVGADVTTIFLDEKSRLWITTDQRYSFQYTDDLVNFEYGPRFQTLEKFDHKNQNASRFIEYDHKLLSPTGMQEIWAIESSGIISKKYKPDSIWQYESPTSPYDMLVDSAGYIWAIFLERGIFTTHLDSTSLVRHPASEELSGIWKTSIELTNHGDIWIGGIDMLNLYIKETDEVINFSDQLKAFSKSSQMRIFDLLVDNQENLWIASDLGLIKATRKISGFTSYLKDKSFRAIEEGPDGLIYVGMYYTVEMLDLEKDSLLVFPIKSNDHNQKHDFEIDPSAITYQDSILWIRGKNSFNLTSKQYKEYPTESWFDYVHTIDVDGRHWIGGNNLLETYEEDIGLYQNYEDPLGLLDLSLLNISAIERGQERDLWIGTNIGLYHLDIDKGATAKYSPNDPDPTKQTSDAPILTICQTNENDVWMGTWGGGLNYLNRKENIITKKTQLDGLPSNFISGILSEGDTVLWISTNNGLARYDIRHDFISIFTEEDGLQSTYFQKYSYLKTSDGKFFFGGDRGLDAFYPDDINQVYLSDENLKVKLTEISHFVGAKNNYNRQIYNLDKLENIELAHNDKLLNIKFAIIDYKSPENHLYSWRVKGYEEEWSKPTHRNIATFSSLPPGAYTFELRASTGRTPWAEPQLSIPIIINEAWYLNGTIHLLTFILTGLIIYLSTKRRYKQKLQRQEELDNLRTKISSDLHDDVGSLLTGLSMQSNVMSYSAEGELKNELKHISAKSREASEIMRDIVWAIDSRKDNYTSLIDKMRDFAETTIPKDRMSYRIDTTGLSGAEEILPDIRQQVYLIFKEVITNAIKHSNGDLIEIDLNRTKHKLHLAISDNGTPQAKRSKTGQGLQNIKMRAKKIEGALQIDFKEGWRVALIVNI